MESDQITLMMKCRREGFEFVKNQKTYCSYDGELECIYREKNKDREYICRNLEKMNLWKYESKCPMIK